MFLCISLHLAPFKLLIFSLILTSSLIKTNSVALSGCHGKCSDSNIPLSFGIIVLAPLVASTLIYVKLRKTKMEDHRSTLFDRNGGNLLKKKLSKRKRSAAAQLKIYTAEEVKMGTNNYSDGRVMRRCNPGAFCRGTFENREAVVMKIPVVPKAKLEQFVDEVIFLSLPHRNLVRVLGCCLETSFPLLVYELHGDGNVTLFDCIRNADTLSRFPCRLRARAAAATARGLAYLQSRNRKGTEFFHGNVCSGNILLDDSFDAKLFYAVGSALIDPDQSASSSEEKSDVYSFGVVLVELLMCRAAEEQENDTNILVSLNEEDLSEEDGEVVRKVNAMAASCLSVRSEERPSMREIEAKLSAWMN